nr:hypothetical protein KPHV_60600 [Kitasatospora purpeofusca]
MTVTVGLGALLVGLALLLRQFLPATWAVVMKKGGGGGGTATATKFDWREHAPFAIGFCIGALAISLPGGLIRTVAAKILGISNGVGGKIVSGGAGGTGHDVQHTVGKSMTATGALVTVLLIVALFILRKTLDKAARQQLMYGALAGITLGLSAGASGLTDSVLIPGVNQIGAAIGGKA